MKKMLIGLLIIAMLFAFCACSRDSLDVDDPVIESSDFETPRDEPQEGEDFVIITPEYSEGDTSAEQSEPEPPTSDDNTVSFVPQPQPEPETDSQKLPSEQKNESEEFDQSAVDALTGVDKLRVDYNLGTCKDLRGEVAVVLFYMDDYESSWTADEITNFTETEVRPGLAFLEREAAKRGIDLKLNIEQIHSSVAYGEKVIISTKKEGYATIDVLNAAAKHLNYSSQEDMISSLKSQYGNEVVCLTMFNKNGASYAINPHRGYKQLAQEHCIVFRYDLKSDRNDPVGSQSSIIAHEILYLYGAESLYSTESRKALAWDYYKADIMLGANYYIITNNIGDATAFYIGWTDEVPAVFDNINW